MKIDNEFKNLIPPLSTDEYKQLEENILRDGIRDPLVVWSQEEILVDGHNRYEIAQKHNLPFATKCVDFKDRDEAMLWIIDNQNGRRNLVPMVRTELKLRKKEILSRKAKKQQGARTDILSTLSKSSFEPINTRKEIARSANVSEGTVHKVETILKKGSDETKQAAREGKISVNEAYKRTVKENAPPKPDPYDAKAKHQEFVENKGNAKVVSFDDIESDKNNQRIVALDLYHAIRKVASGFEVMHLNQTVEELAEDAQALTQEERNYLTTQLYSVKNCADTIIKALQGDLNGKR